MREENDQGNGEFCDGRETYPWIQEKLGDARKTGFRADDPTLRAVRGQPERGSADWFADSRRRAPAGAAPAQPWFYGAEPGDDFGPLAGDGQPGQPAAERLAA